MFIYLYLFIRTHKNVFSKSKLLKNTMSDNEVGCSRAHRNTAYYVSRGKYISI